MSNTYYTSLSGMMAASYGLRNTSNNVANMQSTGYKRTDVFYSSLGNGAGQHGLGSGVCVAGESINFSSGNYQETGSPSDLAVVGNGFFIVKLVNGELLYTRNGQFGFNNDGLLIDKHSGGLVQGYDHRGGLAPISQFGPKISSGKATHCIQLKGEFILSEVDTNSNDSIPPDPDTNKSKYLPIEFSVSIFDDQGKSHKVTLVFESPHKIEGDSNLQWRLIKANCNDGTNINFNEQEIHFSSDLDGTAEAEANSINLTMNNNQKIKINFGSFTDDVDHSVRLNKKNMSPSPRPIEEVKQDGFGFGKQIEFGFDDNGRISYKYSNGQSEEGIHVALALFDDLENTLITAHDNLFRAKNTSSLRIGKPNQENFGTLQPKKLESSNVDSTTEFANIVVLQRMFQACSQIMDIDKQLLEELYQ
jgi:flagellar hook protein FlgE